MGESLRRLGAVLTALLLISGGVGMSPAGPAVGTASAEWVDCGLSDPLLGAAYNTIIGADSGCRWSAGTSTDYENISQTDAYASALGMKDSADSYTTAVGNFQQNARTVAYSKAKLTMVNELNNGSTVSVARAAVNETVESYYSRQQTEIVADWEAKMTQAGYLIGSQNLTSRVDNETVDSFDGYLNNSYTLANGTSTDVLQLRIVSGGTGTGMGWGNPGAYFEAQDPDTSTYTDVVRAREYLDLFNEADSQATQVKANMAPYVDEVYAQYAVGELNSTDLATIDPAVIGQEASTSFNSTGYYGQAAIMLASIGAGGDLNASHNLTVGSTTLDGTLFYTGDDAPTNGWNTSQTYNMSDYSGTFYMAVQKPDGNGTVVDLETYGSSFTINTATNTQTGESLNATKVQTYTYDSTNASALAEEIDRLRALREEYESQATGGGGIGIDIGGAGTGVIVALGAVVILMVVTRD